VAGAVLVAGLAILTELLMGVLERAVSPRVSSTGRAPSAESVVPPRPPDLISV